MLIACLFDDAGQVSLITVGFSLSSYPAHYHSLETWGQDTFFDVLDASIHGCELSVVLALGAF